MKHWSLIAYDIRQPKRLRRVHGYLRKQALALQKSVFLIETDDPHLQQVLAELRARADNREDDIRLYAIPGPASVWTAGKQAAKGAGLYGPDQPGASGSRMHRWFTGLFGKEAA